MQPRQAFAKLVLAEREYYVDQETISLGRQTSTSGPHGPQFLAVGVERSISRKHAELVWNRGKQNWYIVVHGRNGVSVDGKLYKPQTKTGLDGKRRLVPSKPIKLRNMGQIEIEGHRLYLLLPKNTSVPRSEKRKLSQPSSGAASASAPKKHRVELPPPSSS